MMYRSMINTIRAVKNAEMQLPRNNLQNERIKLTDKFSNNNYPNFTKSNNHFPENKTQKLCPNYSSRYIPTHLTHSFLMHPFSTP